AGLKLPILYIYWVYCGSFWPWIRPVPMRRDKIKILYVVDTMVSRIFNCSLRFVSNLWPPASHPPEGRGYRNRCPGAVPHFFRSATNCCCIHPFQRPCSHIGQRFPNGFGETVHGPPRSIGR